jgi:cysteinyl-tRNA synthetase
MATTRLYEKKKFLLTNSMSWKREEFKPARPPKVLFYSCGPTVYGPTHIGNARQVLFADMLFRWLKHIGYDVNYVRNYTDVDDKIIARANEEKVPSIEISRRYIEYCDHDYEMMGLLDPTKVALVTESMDDIIKLVQRIIDRGHAYVVDGEVLFSIESFPTYGKLSGKKVEELQAGARVEVDAKKRSPMDFSLWKPAKPGEPFWQSPWGPGRPGWHIECSAMAGRWLGETIDLHHGGPDLIFPHHENEIAQSEAASGKTFCGFWVHHALLTKGNQKMSKSLGNLIATREFLEKYGAELLKFMYVSFHFRSEVPYTEETLDQALNGLERVYLAKKWAEEASKSKSSVAAGNAAQVWQSLVGKAGELFTKIEDEMFADLNTPGALGHLFSFIREVNRVEAVAGGKPGVPAPSSAERSKVAAEFLELLEKNLFPLWIVFGEKSDAALAQIEKVRRVRRADSAGGVTVPSDDEIRKLLDERNEARKTKNFKRADEIRQQLDALGLVIVDSPQGTTWKSK